MHNPHWPVYLAILLVIGGVSVIQCQNGATNEIIGTTTPQDSSDGTTRAIYSPRLDYNNLWTPIGHGDPLKKDPTYDYSPPVLDRVRYWADTASSAEGAAVAEPKFLSDDETHYYHHHSMAYNHNLKHQSTLNKPKSDILLLGVSAKRPQFKSYESTSNNGLAGSHAMRRNYFQNLPTVLMPPPMVTKPEATQSLVPDELSYQIHSPHGQHGYDMKWYSHPGTADHHAQDTNAHISVIQPSSKLMSLHESGNRLKNSIPAFPSSEYSTNHRKKSWIQALLQKEVTHPQQEPFVSMHQSPTAYESHSQDITPTAFHMSTNTIVNGHNRPYAHPNGIVASVNNLDSTTHFAPTVLPDIVSMTTDTMFSHYQQPEKPMPRPMYLIIEGHSKVKTYGGPSTSSGRHEPKFVPVQSTVDPVVTRVVNEDDDGKYEVRHLHYKQPTPEDSEAKTETVSASPDETNTKPYKVNKMSSLLSLLDTSFGDFFSAKEVTSVTSDGITTELPQTSVSPTSNVTKSIAESNVTLDSTSSAETSTVPMII